MDFLKEKNIEKTNQCDVDKKSSCARCEFDLNLLSKNEIVTINGKQYCDVCAEYINNLSTTQKQSCYCCKKTFPISEMRTWGGKRVCIHCANTGRVANIFNSSHNTAASSTVTTICNLCSKSISGEQIVSVKGRSYCRNCFFRQDGIFICHCCGKALPIKYQYSKSLCLECASNEDYDDGTWEPDLNNSDFTMSTAADYYMARCANNRGRAAKAKKMLESMEEQKTQSST